jgi:hypothetical protein
MDESAVERARERIKGAAAGRDPAAVDALVERTREQLEGLAALATELESSLPDRIQDALRDEARPVARNLAEVRGLMNQVIRRLEHLEGNMLGERHERVDDLALIVELITSGWSSVDDRLARLETLVGRLENGLEHRGTGAIVYRMEDRRPDAVST